MKISELHSQLYHYTTLQGLLGIINEKCIWATHYKFLNDYSEIKRFKSKLIETLYPFILDQYREFSRKLPQAEIDKLANGGLDAYTKRDSEWYIESCYNSLYKVAHDEIYIASFCGEHSDVQRFLYLLSHHKNSYEWFMYPIASSCVTIDMPLFIAWYNASDVLGFCLRTQCFIFENASSIGLSAGEYGGKKRCDTLCSFKKRLTIFAWCTGKLSIINVLPPESSFRT